MVGLQVTLPVPGGPWMQCTGEDSAAVKALSCVPYKFAFAVKRHILSIRRVLSSCARRCTWDPFKHIHRINITHFHIIAVNRGEGMVILMALIAMTL